MQDAETKYWFYKGLVEGLTEAASVTNDKAVQLSLTRARVKLSEIERQMRASKPA